jgi:YHS domain-containing protein
VLNDGLLVVLKKTIMKKLWIGFFSIVLTHVMFAQSADVRHKQFNLEDGIALQEYDPVAYFTVKKALKGKKEFTYNYQGVVYYFYSQDNKYLFMKNPGNYEPQYGGWCAYAMGNSGDKVEIDPKTFKIVDGKLYLFYNFYFTNTLTKWNEQGEQMLKMKADKNWVKIISGK